MLRGGTLHEPEHREDNNPHAGWRRSASRTEGASGIMSGVGGIIWTGRRPEEKNLTKIP